MKRIKRVVLHIILASIVCIATGCGDDMNCGEGTVRVGGRCVPEASQCGPGTTDEGGICIPVCTGDKYWDGENCVDAPDCGAGTTFDSETGMCLPDEYTCAEGASMVDGVCVPDLACSEGTRPDEFGRCVVDTPGDPDVWESENPDENAPFDLPEAGGSITLGGIIDDPVDPEGDGYKRPDWDGFEFHGQAGTYLRVRALSEGAARPAFVLLSEDPEDPSLTTYIRYCLEPNQQHSEREFFLPHDGVYVLLVTDYNHLAGYLFGTLVLPVGGPEFDYHVIVENLGTPSADEIETLPEEFHGQIDRGRLFFYRVEDLVSETPTVFRSLGEPASEAYSDVFPALMLFEEGELISERISFTTYENAEIVFAPKDFSDYLVVLDHLLMIGPERAYSLQALEPGIQNCTGGACSTGSVPIGSEVLLMWDMQPDQLLAARFGMADTAWAAMSAYWLGPDLAPLQADQYVFPGRNGWGRVFAEHAGPRYLWFRWSEGDTPGDFFIDEQLRTTPTLVMGETNTGLTVESLPPGAVPDMNMEYALNAAAFANIKLTEGEIVFFDSFTPTSGDWSTMYKEWLVTPEFEPVGPVVDVSAWNFPDGFVTPNFAYVRESGTYVHWVYDLWSDITDATYSVRPVARTPVTLDEPTHGQPVSADLQLLSGGLRFYIFEHQKDLDLDITVTPGTLSGNLQPRVWILNFGRPVWDWIFYVWRPEPNGGRMGLVENNTALAGGDPVTVSYATPYDGKSIVLVMNAGTPGQFLYYSIDIQVTN